MLDLQTVMMVVGLGLGALLQAQEPEVREAKPPVTEPAESGQAKSARTPEQWIADLGNESYRIRVEAEKALRGLGNEALPALRKAAESSTDKEIQWRARRLERQIERGDSVGLERLQVRDQQPQGPQRVPQVPGGGQPGLPDDFRTRFEEMFGRMEREFGLDIPRARFFDDSFFRDLQEQMKQGSKATSQGMSMQIGPDGAVRVEVKSKNDKGEVESKVYEAPDLDTFHKQYPGVLQQSGIAMPFRIWMDGMPGARLDAPNQWGQPWRLQRPRANAVVPEPMDAPDAVLPPDGARLGVVVRPEIPAELREHLELPDGVGLMVESLQPDSLAAALGLARGDIVLRIGTRDVGSPADVQDALGRIGAGEAVEVQFLRKGAAKTATAKKPAPAKAADDKAEGNGRLERRPAKGETIR